MSQQEIEVKLELDGDEAASARLQEQLAERFGPGRTVALTSTYFDTADLALRDAAVSLRVREQEGRRVQTIKSRSSRKGGMFSRREWEREINGEVPDLDAAEDTPLAPLLKQDGVRSSLAPAFQSLVQRTIWDVALDDTRVEVALDRGFIKADGRSSPICEVELELKAGDPTELVSLARSLDAMAPLRLGSRTKADRGYQLLEKTDREAAPAEPAALSADMTVGQAFQTLAGGCIRHFMLNEPLLIRNRSEGALHQVRVALRRLRSAFTLFKGIVADQESDVLKARLQTLASALGDSRDLDVLLDALIEGGAEDEAAVSLAGQLRAKREEAYDAAIAALHAPDARRLMLDLSVWLEAGPWTQADRPERDAPIVPFAEAALRKRRAKVKARGRHFGQLSSEELHQLRIAAKKLRYAAEFFAPLHHDKKAQRRRRAFLEAVKDLQTALGDLNDITQADALAHTLADDFAERRTSQGSRRTLIFALGREIGRRGAESDARLKQAAAAYDRFAAAKRYW
jgi:inorganic triphosphatase YgiF